jgi:hypothetical protein
VIPHDRWFVSSSGRACAWGRPDAAGYTYTLGCAELAEHGPLTQGRPQAGLLGGVEPGPTQEIANAAQHGLRVVELRQPRHLDRHRDSRRGGLVAAHQIKVTDANRPWTSPGAAHHRTLCRR